MKRTGSAVWSGRIKDGRGTVSTESGVLKDTQYSFSTRFENGAGTNPEELIAAAHAACFSMALSGQLEKGGVAPAEIRTTAAVTMNKDDSGFTITSVHLQVSASVAEGDQAGFRKAAEEAKSGCPVSKVLNAEITMDVSFT